MKNKTILGLKFKDSAPRIPDNMTPINKTGCSFFPKGFGLFIQFGFHVGQWDDSKSNPVKTLLCF